MSVTQKFSAGVIIHQRAKNLEIQILLEDFIGFPKL